MNSLATRIALAIVIVVLVIVALISLSIARTTDRAFRGYLLRTLQPQTEELRIILSDYYRTHGSWEGVHDALRAYLRSRNRQIPASRRPILVITNEEGIVVVGTAGIRPGRPLPRPLRPFATPITVEGREVGRLVLLPPGMEGVRLPGAERAFLDQIQRTVVFVALLAVGLGILLSVILTRTITSPLQSLARAARTLSQREFHYRVPERGPEEVAAVARAFNEMATALEEAEERQRQLLADIAHELRTPLSVLQANLRAMLDGVYPLEPKEIAALYDEARHVNRLVDDLHVLALADIGQLPLKEETVDVGDLIRQTTATFALAAEARGVHVHTDVEPGPLLVNADPDRLAQVVRNLLSNALRHTPEGGRIDVRAFRQDGHVCVEVQDTGPGIPPEHLPHVFDRFWRGDPSRARETGGSGLGLSIARSLIHAMGGRIGVNSQVGQGSTFWVELLMLSIGSEETARERSSE